LIRKGVVRRCLTAAALLFSYALPASAQTLTTGAVTGVVRDARGNTLSDVLVSVIGPGIGSRSVFTDLDGGFTVPEVPPGDYAVRAERIGFVPRAYTSIPVLPDRAVSISIVLRATSDPTPALDSQRFMAGAIAMADAGQGLWVSSGLLRDLPFMRGELDEVARLSSRADGALGFEGLPASLTSLAVDGFSFRPASLPISTDAPPAGTMFPLATASAVAVSAPQMDVEWGGAAGANVTAYARRPSQGLNGAARLSGSEGLGSNSYTHGQGSLSVEGSFLGDSARFGMNISARQGQLPVSAKWSGSPHADGLVEVARAAAGLELGQHLRAGTFEDNALAGSGRVSLRAGGRHSIESLFAAAMVPEASVSISGPLSERLESGSDALAAVSVHTSIGSALSNNLRVSFTRSARETVAGDLPLTLFAAGGEQFGSAGAVRAVETAAQLSDAVELQRGRSTLKAGAELLWSSYDHSNRPALPGQFSFGSATQLGTGAGYFERITGGVPDVSFSAPRIAVFAQNRWTSPIGAEVTVGFRAEQSSLRTDSHQADPEFLTLTGIASNRTPPAAWSISPRVGARWDVRNEHEWVLHAAAGVFSDRLDPSLVSSWLTDNGTATVSQLAGDVGVNFPDEPAGVRTARRVTLLDGDLRGPQSARLSAGVTRSVGAGGSIELSGVYRDTRYLPSRTDLNMIPAPAGTDIYGRAVYGQLVQSGELVVAEPGTNRRFSSYDEVAALRTDGRARYWGVTLGTQFDALSSLSVLARYTFSHATDDWFGARTGGWAIAGPGAIPGAENWTEGTSDFDAPHRAVVALGYAAPFGIGVSGIYRFESGRPFTPGFQPGVDMNGDGYAGNDPAFIDPAIPGTSELISKWSCLDAGAFAERNACRARNTHSFDARLRVPVLRGDGLRAAVVIDGLNIFDTRVALPDAALYVVDPAGTVVETGGVVSVPLTANPSFCSGRARAASMRVLRLGISLDW
jgi:hypothetical protein